MRIATNLLGVTAALAALSCAGPTLAGIVVYPDEENGGTDSLLSWGYETVENHVMVDEEWIDAGPVAFMFGDADWQYNGGGAGPGGIDILIDKLVTNSTDFDWSGFQIDLVPMPGTSLEVEVGSIVSDRYSQIDVSTPGDGSVSLTFSTDPLAGDIAVGFGETAAFQFSMTVFGDIAFSMIETPIPEPGALALLAIAGVSAVRRRRRTPVRECERHVSPLRH